MKEFINLLGIFVISLSFFDMVFELLITKERVIDKVIAFILVGGFIGLFLLGISIGA
ncbi:TPA: hypothetical protein PQC75_002575 [Staphylococcus aureus]|nr:hypothetical protein [Staphylococcus aureus]